MSEQSTHDDRRKELGQLKKAELIERLIELENVPAPDQDAEQVHNDHVLVVRVMAILWSYMFRVRHSSAKALTDRKFRMGLDAALRDSAAVGYRERETLKEAMGNTPEGIKSYQDLTHAMNFEGWEKAVAQAQEEGLEKTARDLIAKA